MFTILGSIVNFAQVEEKPLSFREGLLRINQYIESLDTTFTDHHNSLLLNDLAKLDSIYFFALESLNNDRSEALLALTFATLPFKNMILRSPIIGYNLNVPLPFINHYNFEKRKINLPKTFFNDSPTTDFGDKDKIAHFFGNAFFSYNLGWISSIKLIGIFLEYFEDSFRVDGGYSNRDITANLLGELFGNMLRNQKNIYPSVIFNLFNVYFSGHVYLGLIL